MCPEPKGEGGVPSRIDTTPALVDAKAMQLTACRRRPIQSLKKVARCVTKAGDANTPQPVCSDQRNEVSECVRLGRRVCIIDSKRLQAALPGSISSEWQEPQ